MAKIFLTGASGFVGSFLLEKLLENSNNEVSILLRNPDSAWRINHLLKRVKIITGSLSEIKDFESELMDFCPTVFVHLGWDGVGGSDRNDSRQWGNVASTIGLVDLAIKTGAEKLVGLGSQAEYGPCSSVINESQATNPTTLYGVSKLAACNYSRILCNQYGIIFSWLRLFSSFGPKDGPNWLIPYLINTLLSGKVPKLTKAEQLWDFIYVKDVASAIESVIDCKQASGIFNLGSGSAPRLRDTIEAIRDLIDPSLQLEFGRVEYRSDQVMWLQAETTKLRAMTGWQPQYESTDALKETIDWFLRAKK